MLGKRKPQPDLFDVGNVYPLALNPKSFHAQLASAGRRLFDDETFAEIYCNNNGRPSVPPSLLALTVLLQNEAGVSDEEAIERTRYDLRWAAVLGRLAGEPLCAKSTLQLFRTHLLLHSKVMAVFSASIVEAKRSGLLKGKALRVAIDTRPITGRGQVEDTINLIATAIRQVAVVLAKQKKLKMNDWLQANGLSRYSASSIKAAGDIDWSDSAERNKFLSVLVNDAREVLALASTGGEEAIQSAELLSQILIQDIEPVEPTEIEGEDGSRIVQGTASGRVPSVTDPEQRHGRKSKSKVFIGHKASIATDIDSQIIVAIEVIPGNAGDSTGALELVKQAEANTDLNVDETIGDCAYGGANTRASFAEAGRTLHAKVPAEADRGMFPKRAFTIDLVNNTVTCPEGITSTSYRMDAAGGKTFTFGNACQSCPLKIYCTTSQKSRTLHVHPKEALIQQARDYQHSPHGKAHLRQRVVVEHRLARLAQLGIGQARYVGRQKTQFQLVIAATIANLRRTWNWEAV